MTRIHFDWTAEQDQALIRWRSYEDRMFSWIGEQLDRPAGVCAARYRAITTRPASPRAGNTWCLRCRVSFKSPDPGRIRICPPCKAANARDSVGAIAEASTTGHATRPRMSS